MPLLLFSVTSTPFDRVETTWKSVWSPMTASTPFTLSARSTSGPVGAVSVPAVAPMWPIATIAATPFLCPIWAARWLTAARGSVTLKFPSEPGEVSSGMSGFENPITASLNDPKSMTRDFDHSDGVPCRDRDRVAAGLRSVDIEPRLQEGRTPDREARAERIGGLRQRDQLTVIVADVENRHFLQ